MKMSKKRFKNLVKQIVVEVGDNATEFINLDKSDVSVHVGDGKVSFDVYDLKVDKKYLKILIADAIVDYFEILAND